MCKHIFIFSVWITLLSGAALGQDLDWEQLVSGNLDFRVVMVNPKDNRIIFAGQPGSLLKSVNGGKDWRRVLSIRGRLRDIHEVKANSSNCNLLFAATDSGLYRSDDAGERWVRIFRGKKERENYCKTIAVCDQLILAGTKAGLFISRDNGRSWYKQGEGLAGKEILNIDCGPDADKVIYLAAQNGVFKSIDSAQSWENVYPAVDSDNEDEALADSQEGELAKRTEIRFVKADRININLVYLATGKGV